MKEVIKLLKGELIDSQNKLIFTNKVIKEKGIQSDYYNDIKSKEMRYEAQLIMALKILTGARR